MRRIFPGNEYVTCSTTMRYTIILLAALLIISVTVLRAERTAQAVGTPAGGIPSVSPGNSGANIVAAVDCESDSVEITSTKDVSYVKFDDQRGKMDSLSGKKLIYPIGDATKVWVKSGTTVASFDIGGQCDDGTTNGGTTAENEDEDLTNGGTTVENEDTTVEDEDTTVGGGTTVENGDTTEGTTVEDEDTSGGDTSGGDTSGGDTSGGDTSGGDDPVVVEPPVIVKPPVVVGPPIVVKPPVVKKPQIKKPSVQKPRAKKPQVKRPRLKQVAKVSPKVVAKQPAECGKGTLMVKRERDMVVTGKTYTCVSNGKMTVSIHAGKGVSIVGPNGLNVKTG